MGWKEFRFPGRKTELFKNKKEKTGENLSIFTGFWS